MERCLWAAPELVSWYEHRPCCTVQWSLTVTAALLVCSKRQNQSRRAKKWGILIKWITSIHKQETRQTISSGEKKKAMSETEDCCVSQQEEHKYIYTTKNHWAVLRQFEKKIGFSQPTDVNVFLISCWYKSEVHEICQNTKADKHTASQSRVSFLDCPPAESLTVAALFLTGSLMD